MDRESLKRYAQSVAITLGAIDEQETRLAQGLKERLSDLKQTQNRSIQNAKTQSANRCTVCLTRLRNSLAHLEKPKGSVLDVCEYLQLGQLDFSGMSRLEGGLKEIPLVLPMIGHGNLLLAHSSVNTRDMLAEVVWRILSATAPGQLQVITYNPQLLNHLSFLSNLEQFTTIRSENELEKLLQDITSDILAVDRKLKEEYRSLVELRRISRQPVDELKLIVLQDTAFLENEELERLFRQAAINSPRAGICFVLSDVVTPETQQQIKGIPTFRQLNVHSDYQLQSATFLRRVSYRFQEKNYAPEVKAYLQRAAETSVESIPFASIEETRRFWQDTTRDGITFSLGRMGPEVVRLRLGDEIGQLHNVLITGAAGQGKSNLLEVVIHSMCTRYSPDELELFLLDFKDGLTFKPYSSHSFGSYLPHARVLGLESERDMGLAVLEHMERIRQERADTFKKLGNYRNIAECRSHRPDLRMPRIVLMIDEYQKLFESTDGIGTKAAELLENLVRQGRACGIHVFLASQTISGAPALLGHTDAIYAQFPIRIALKNSLTESYAVLGQGNDGAARLQVRGEAILNTNYGERNANQRFTVAYADPEVLKELRQRWCQFPGKDHQPPVVLQRDDTFDITCLFASIKAWRRKVAEDQASPRIPCGVSLTVNRKQISVQMSNDAGRNVAIIGSGADANNSKERNNDAIGLLQAMSVALALQHVDGKARFTCVNGMDNTMYSRNGMEDWRRLMAFLGFHVNMVDKKEAPEFFRKTAEEIISDGGESGEAHYILCFAMDRCSTMDIAMPKPAPSLLGGGGFALPLQGEKGTEAFQRVLQYGSACGTHVIGWWTNAAIYKNHIGFMGAGFINTTLLLRVDGNTAQNLLGAFTQWSAQPNRVLVHDSTDLETNLVAVPYKPVSQQNCSRMRAEVWDA